MRLAKAQPYECYEEMEFDIPSAVMVIATTATIRMEEMRQAMHGMRQCLERLGSPDGAGPVAVRDFKVTPPRVRP